jgi:hypothetical protein
VILVGAVGRRAPKRAPRRRRRAGVGAGSACELLVGEGRLEKKVGVEVGGAEGVAARG